jgi:hypothetical protein
VTFQVVNGPDSGQTGKATTDAAGHASYSVTAAVAGMDSIQPTYVDATGTTRTSNPAQVTFTAGGGVVISALSVKDTADAAKWSLQSNLQLGATLYGDRTYTLAAAPSLVLGAPWIRTAGASKVYAGNPLVTFTINQQADVFVGMDQRAGRPAWLDATWSDTGLTETATTGIVYEVFRKTFPAGPVALGPVAAASATSKVVTYTVAVR